MATYIDVTRLITWQGNYTGMERFAFEVTKYFVTEAKADVRLCCFTPAAGFVALENAFSMDEGRLTSPLFGPSPALRALAKTNKKALLYHYAKRKQQRSQHKKLQRLATDKGDTLIIYDGLWDQEAYITAVEEQLAKGVRLAHFVCDLVPLVMPQVCYDFVSTAFGNYFQRIAPQIDVLFSISKHTQKDFESVFASKLKPTIKKQVIRFGDNFGSKTKAEVPVNLMLKAQDFLLAVGTVEVRKNYQLLYQTYRLALEQKQTLPKLVIVGREGWLAEATVYAIKNDPLVKDHIVFAGPINDAELNWLYDNCLFTVFPSLYEGWGLPVAESLYHGKVCAAASSSSVPEIGGELNQYYSPYSAQQCLDVILKLLDNSFRQKLEKAIHRSYQSTTWSYSSQQVAATLDLS